MNKTIAIIMKQIMSDDNKKIYRANGMTFIDEETLTDENGIVYTSLFETDESENLISYMIDAKTLMELYGCDEQEAIDKYYETIEKYLVLINGEDKKILYNGENETALLTFEEYPTHLINHANPNNEDDFNPQRLYNALKNNVYGQDEAIKKITTALVLHYADVDENQKTSIIIDGDKGTGKTTIIETLKKALPVSVLVEDLGSPNFSFDNLFLGLYNSKNITPCPILVLDNADKLLLNKDIDLANTSIETIKKLMLGVDYKLAVNSGTINYPTNDFVIIVMGDFKKRLRCGIDNYVEGVPEKLSILTNYNIKMRPLNKEMVYGKLLDSNNGILKHYSNYLTELGVNLNVHKKCIDKIVNEVMQTNMHELDKIVEKCFEEALFEICIEEKECQKVYFDSKILKNSKKYKLD